MLARILLITGIIAVLSAGAAVALSAADASPGLYYATGLVVCALASWQLVSFRRSRASSVTLSLPRAQVDVLIERVRELNEEASPQSEHLFDPGEPEGIEVTVAGLAGGRVIKRYVKGPYIKGPSLVVPLEDGSATEVDLEELQDAAESETTEQSRGG